MRNMNFTKRRALFASFIAMTTLAAVLFAACPTMAQTVAANSDEVMFRLSLEGQSFSKAVNILLLMTALSLVPAMIMMMTSFLRIVIVLSILKQALAIRQAPSAKVISTLALFLTIFIMRPVWTEIYDNAITPFSEKKIDEKTAVMRGSAPLKAFMLRQTRESSLLMFMELSKMKPVASPDELPMSVVVPAFMLSELKTAFQMGFLIYLPFLVVDVVVATTLMSMGMMMLPPMMISVPFKILLFIIVDGWGMTVRSLVGSFS